MSFRKHRTLEAWFADTAEANKPTDNRSVLVTADRDRIISTPSGQYIDWDSSVAPYTREIMEEMSSILRKQVVFVAPARAGKTQLMYNLLTHVAIYEPCNVMILFINEEKAREISKGEFDEFLLANPKVSSKIAPGRSSRTVHDIKFKTGHHWYLKNPTLNNLSGGSYRMVIRYDADQAEQVVGSRLPVASGALNRTRTFGRRAMVYSESSPGFPISDQNWIEPGGYSHEAPPAQGILSLYNAGDRRRWYWPCPHCGEFINSRFRDYVYDANLSPTKAGEGAKLRCTACAELIEFKDRAQMNARGRWLKEGQRIDRAGVITGSAEVNAIASFHLFGPAAVFMTWADQVTEYMKALNEFNATGDESMLMNVAYTVAGEPYRAMRPLGARLPEDLKTLAFEHEPNTLPKDARYLLATVDPNGTFFACQVQAVCENDTVRVIDRWNIVLSDRVDDRGDKQPIRPGTYEEDWRILIDQVLERQYPTGDGRFMRIKMMGYDTGGNDNMTTNGYQFFRWVKKNRPELLLRIQPFKGGGPNSMLTEVRAPESTKKGQVNAAHGDIPVLFDNPDRMKDRVNELINRGGERMDGGIMFSDQLDDSFFVEMTVEVKDAKGHWEKPKKGPRQRNESWDLTRIAMAMLACSHPRLGFNIYRHGGFPWTKPPAWAREWDENVLVLNPEEPEKRPMAVVRDRTAVRERLARALN